MVKNHYYTFLSQSSKNISSILSRQISQCKNSLQKHSDHEHLSVVQDFIEADTISLDLVDMSEHTPALRSGSFLLLRRLLHNTIRARKSYTLSTGVTSRMTYGSRGLSLAFFTNIYRRVYISVIFRTALGTFPVSDTQVLCRLVPVSAYMTYLA